MNKHRLAYIAFATYFVTGVICMMIGASMTYLQAWFAKPIERIVLIISFFALGRISSAYPIGKLVEEHDPLKILFVGICLMLIYNLGIGFIPNLVLAFIFAFLGGVGMSCQDAICPLILSKIYPKSYSSSLSAGQSIYSLGGFVISWLIGFFVARGLPFNIANIVLSIVGISILIVIPFTKLQGSEETVDEQLKPLYTKNKKLCLILVLICCLLYCSLVNTLLSYLTSILETLGNSPSNANYVLALYNFFAVIGSIAFISILAMASEKKVLVVNTLVAIIALVFAALYTNIYVHYLAFGISGFVLGVLFSVILALATRIEYEHISVISGLIGTFGALGDIIAPIISSYVVTNFGVLSTGYLVILCLIVMMILSLIIYYYTKEEKYGDSK